MEMKCLIVLLQISWVFAQGNGGFEGMDDFGGFSLIQKDLQSDGAGIGNDTSANDTSTDQHLPQPAAPAAGAGGDQSLLFQPGAGGGVQADQPQHEPTRLPSLGAPTTPPPLVRPEVTNATGNATTVTPPPSESPKSKGEGGGSAEIIGNFMLVLCGTTVLHLLY